MKNLLYLLFVLPLLFSCGDASEDEKNNNSSIIGEWKSDAGVSYIFYEDGTALEKGPFAELKRTYEINGKELCIQDVEIEDAITCADFQLQGDALTWFGITYKRK